MTQATDTNQNVRAVRQLGQWVVWYKKTRIISVYTAAKATAVVEALKPYDTGTARLSDARLNTLKTVALAAAQQA